MRKNDYDNIERDVIMAQKLGYGCHYGHYKADHPRTRPEDQEEIFVPGGPSGKAEERRTGVGTCPGCGKTFWKGHHSRIYCSGDCALKCSRIRARERAARLQAENRREVACGVCGKLFYPDKVRHLYCCKECSEEGARRVQENNRAKKTGANRKDNNAQNSEIA